MHIPPQSLRDSPYGHGERIHQTPSVASRTFHPTPSRFATAPEGHGERFPRTPSVASLRIT